MASYKGTNTIKNTNAKNKINNFINTPSKSIDLQDKTGFYDNKKGAIFDNIYIVLSILAIAFLCIGYVVYIYLYAPTENIIKSSSTYYGQNVLLYEPVFQQQSSTITDCINTCNNDLTCDGITYNNDTQLCVGTNKGQIRNDTTAYNAWVKPKKIIKNNLTDFTKSILIGYTKIARLILGEKISRPYMIGYFCYSFNLTIYDFNKNYGVWRHIFHKGTHIQQDTQLNFQSWENLVKEIPNQTIGVWLAPFTNNLRIAITTTSIVNNNRGYYKDAFIQKCSDNDDNDDNDDDDAINNKNNTDTYKNNCYITDMPSGRWSDKSKSGDGTTPKTSLKTYVEYFDNDLQNIPINTQLNILINVRNTNAEVYFNGKITQVFQLNGTPQFDKTNLYALQDKTTNCDLSNLIYYPDALKLDSVNKIVNLSPATE